MRHRPEDEVEALAAALLRQMGGRPPTLKELIRHAQLFGTDCVLETGQAFLDPDDLLRLRVALDRLEGGHAGRPFRRTPKRRRSRAETRQAVACLLADGLVPAAIAELLEVRERYVRQLAAELRQPRERARA